MSSALIGAGVVVLLAILIALKSIQFIGASEVGLVNKRFGIKKLSEDNPVAFHG